MHSEFCGVVTVLGFLHVGGVGVVSLVVGKGLDPSFSRAMSCELFRLPFTESINPAMPDTIGAEKLVPRFVLKSSV